MVASQRQIRIQMTSKSGKGRSFSTNTKFLRFSHSLIIRCYNLFQTISFDLRRIYCSHSQVWPLPLQLYWTPCRFTWNCKLCCWIDNVGIFPWACNTRRNVVQTVRWEFAVKERVIHNQSEVTLISRGFICLFLLIHCDISPTMLHARMYSATWTQ